MQLLYTLWTKLFFRSTRITFWQHLYLAYFAFLGYHVFRSIVLLQGMFGQW